MHIIIFANGRLNHPIHLPPADVILAADGGAQHCLDLGLVPHFVIGDMDSVDESTLAQLASAGSKILRFPRRKDFTDLELAIQHAESLGAEQVTLLAALGDRWDQTFANLFLAASHPKLKIRILDGQQEIYFLKGGESLEISGSAGDTLSLVPLSEVAAGISTENLEYPLKKEALEFGSTRGISNVLLDTNASIKLDQGLLMCTLIHLEKEQNVHPEV